MVRVAVASFAVTLFLCRSQASRTTPFRADVPRMWVDAEMAQLELPLPRAKYSLRPVSAEYYYRMQVRPVYRTYPVYAAGREPAGYIERLSKEAPADAFDAGSLRTEQDWIRAGELVFDAPILFEAPISMNAVHDPAFIARTGDARPAGRNHSVCPVCRPEEGRRRTRQFSCGMCHTRVQADGSVIKGAQGNFPGDRAVAFEVRRLAKTQEPEAALKARIQDARATFGIPWADPDPLHGKWLTRPFEEQLAIFDAIPPGVFARHRASPFAPTQLPDLIGVKNRRYLDKSGLQQHRGIVDLMRYAALNQGADDVGDYGGFIPVAPDFRTPCGSSHDGSVQRRATLRARAVHLHAPSTAKPKRV